MPSNVVRTNRPTIFTTNLKASALSNRYDSVTIQNQQESNIGNTGSFRYDQIGAALKSTQEIPLDYTKFENHTFYNSAVAKVNIGFDQIINNYPFDSSNTEIENFEDNLTGYERYLLSLFSKNKNFLLFDGTSHVAVIDSAGVNFPNISKDDSGAGILDPHSNNFAFEVFCYPAAVANDNQIILQKKKDNNSAITIALSQSATTTECKAIFAISNGTLFATASSNIQKGKFNHLYCEYFAEDATGSLKIYTNLERTSTEQDSLNFGDLTFNNASLTIGSGSAHTIGSLIFHPKELLSGALDELRFFHSTISKNDLSYNWKKEIYATPDLKLYFKFNEPTGSYGANNVVLDYSGNSLHSYIQNFSSVLRESAGIENPMSAEDIERCPVLFADYPATVALNQDLLNKARSYDADNPNLITKLIPAHYLREGYVSQGFVDEDGNIGNEITSTSFPGTAIIGEPQIISAVLFVYAKFFDELKIFVDHFSNLVHVDYDQNESIADKFLPFLANYYGFELPSLFKSGLSDQFYDARNITQNDEKSQNSFDFIRKQLWRRILINMSDIMREKGTNASVRSLFLASGINPDNFFTIREFGGPKKNFLTGRRETKSETSTMLDFSGSLTTNAGTLDGQGFSSTKPHIIGSYLSGSRVEPGFPKIAGTISDGLMTSGSFTFEAMYKFLPSQVVYPSESLMRLHVTGTTAPSSTHGVVVNLVATSGSDDYQKTVTLIARPMVGIGANVLTLPITGVDIFDGDAWKISFGRQRNDEVGNLSSSYYLKVGKNIDQDTYVVFTTSSYFYDTDSFSETNIFQNIGAYNESGSFIVIGSQSLTPNSTFLNSTSNLSKTTNFSGRVSQLKMWSKSQTDGEFIEHVRNYKSLGVENPLINFSFDTETTGTFERLRLDASTDQDITSSNNLGQIEIFDFSQNNLSFNGYSFDTTKNVIKPETFYYSHIAPNFDQSTTTNKVRVSSLQFPEQNKNIAARLAPVYSVTQADEAYDDRRYLIEYSVVKALNEDIIRLMSDIDFFNNALGKPSFIYDHYYPELDQLQKIYFNRLSGQLNFKVFFDLFKWFDTSYTALVESLMPKKTQFLGINYTIESHILERHRMRYLYDQQYTLGTVSVENETGIGFETGTIE